MRVFLGWLRGERINRRQPTLPRPGQRTYLGCAYLYIEAALTELTPSVRREVAKDLRACIDLLTKSEPTLVEAPSITPGLAMARGSRLHWHSSFSSLAAFPSGGTDVHSVGFSRASRSDWT